MLITPLCNRCICCSAAAYRFNTMHSPMHLHSTPVTLPPYEKQTADKLRNKDARHCAWRRWATALDSPAGWMQQADLLHITAHSHTPNQHSSCCCRACTDDRPTSSHPPLAPSDHHSHHSPPHPKTRADRQADHPLLSASIVQLPWQLKVPQEQQRCQHLRAWLPHSIGTATPIPAHSQPSIPAPRGEAASTGLHKWFPQPTPSPGAAANSDDCC